MKRLLSIILICSMCVSLCAMLGSCNGATTPTDTSSPTDGSTDNSTSTDKATDKVTDDVTDAVTDSVTDSVTDDNKGDETLTSLLAGIKPKDGKKVRIAFIGDSITEGVGAGSLAQRPIDGYPGQLQTLLGDDYVVGNFGKGSAYTLAADNQYNIKTDATLSYKNTQQYKDSLKFGADVVVIMMGVNDIRSMSCDEAAIELKKALRALADEYAAMDTVQKVIIATSIYIPSSITIYQYSDGPLQEIQKAVAKEGGYGLIDIYGMTRDYLNVMMHYTSDIVHPNKESYGEIARAYYASLMGKEFTPTVPDKSKTGVVYVKSSGVTRGLGETEATAVNSLAKAVGLLRDGGGTIVICGKYSLTYEAHLPIHNGTITITSKYNGVDYAKSKGATLGLAKNLYFYGDYKIENITVVSELANVFITCNYNNVTFGDNITNTLATGITTYPLILVGHNIALGDVPLEDITLHGTCNIVVNSGTWAYLRGGNRRSSQNYPIGTTDKDAVLNITINGGTFNNPAGAQNLTSGTGMGSFAGTLNFTINGGTFKGGVYAVSRVGGNFTSTPAEMSGKVNLVINGGTFNSNIWATHDNTTKVTGKISVKVKKSLASKLVGFTDITEI